MEVMPQLADADAEAEAEADPRPIKFKVIREKKCDASHCPGRLIVHPSIHPSIHVQYRIARTSGL